MPLPATFQCKLDVRAFAACGSPVTYAVAGGRHTFGVRALSPYGIVADPTPATATWTVLQCKVPKLKGLSLAHARKALAKAHCALGKVTKPRKPKHGRLPALVVRSSSPKAGALHSAGIKVKLALGPKPKPKPKRRARR